jgi:hypothetical protein
MIGGNKRYPHTLRFAVITYAIVDEVDYDDFNLFRWHAQWDEGSRTYFPVRKEHTGRKTIHVLLAREILGLPRSPGRNTDEQADHIDHNPLNNTRVNLRVVTQSQNNANQRRRHDANGRYRGVTPNRGGYLASFKHEGNGHFFPTVPLEAEAAFMFNHAVRLLRDPHAQVNDIPLNELPSQQRQAELTALVENKLRSKGLIP